MDINLLQKLYDVVKIPLQYIEDNVCEFTSGGFDPNPAALIIKCAINSPHTSCYTVVYDHQYYGLLRVSESDNNKYILVGPVMSQVCSRSQARKILSDLHQPVSRIDELVLWLNSTPLYDVQRFCAFMDYIDFTFNGVNNRKVVFIPYIKGSSVVYEQAQKPDFMISFTDSLERELVSCIEYGRPELLESLFDHYLADGHDGVPMVAANEIRSMKNIMLFSVGVASRAALKGGLDYNTVTLITTNYLEQFERYDSYQGLFNLFKMMFLDFARRTARARLTLTNTAVVMNISKTALSRIYEKTTPTMIADALGMNVSYLCTHFKRETGKTISEYVNEIKVTECKRLLETSDMPVSQISEHLGYSSQNYLIKVFKKITGTTPTEYRNSVS